MSLICEDLSKHHGWNVNLCCPVCHGMGRYFTAVVRYKKTQHMQNIVTCCKGMRCVFEDVGWVLLGFDPDDGPFFECRSSDELDVPEWRRRMLGIKPPPPKQFPSSVKVMTLEQAVAALKKMPPYLEVHRRRKN